MREAEPRSFVNCPKRRRPEMYGTCEAVCFPATSPNERLSNLSLPITHKACETRLRASNEHHIAGSSIPSCGVVDVESERDERFQTVRTCSLPLPFPPTSFRVASAHIVADVFNLARSTTSRLSMSIWYILFLTTHRPTKHPALRLDLY